jgi:hypothetical protein
VVILLPFLGESNKHVMCTGRPYFDIFIRYLVNVDLAFLFLCFDFHSSLLPDDYQVIADDVVVDGIVQCILSTYIHDSREVRKGEGTTGCQPCKLITYCKSYPKNVLVVRYASLEVFGEITNYFMHRYVNREDLSLNVLLSLLLVQTDVILPTPSP